MDLLKPSFVREEARKKLSGVWHIPVLFYIVASTLLSILNMFVDNGSTVLSFLVSLLVMLIVIDLADHLGEQRTFKLSMDRLANNKALGSVVILGVVVYIKLVLWTLLFIIPGIYKFYEYSQSYYICYEAAKAGQPKKIKQCLLESKQMMNGNKMNLFMVHLSLFAWILIYLIVLIIAVFYTDTYSLFAILLLSIVSSVVGAFYLVYLEMIDYTFYKNLKTIQGGNNDLEDFRDEYDILD